MIFSESRFALFQIMRLPAGRGADIRTPIPDLDLGHVAQRESTTLTW
jgi:hypothetical protein